jgi:type IV pilus assembly protein PilY1
MTYQPTNSTARRSLIAPALFAGAALVSGTALSATSPPAAIPISQVPLTVAVPAHPQVLFALANSQSMDGNLSGAIMTGSGALGSDVAGLNASSSPVNYTVPAGFTAPVSNTAAGNSAAYTVTQSGVQYDNSNSRLNVAKGGITSILNTFLANADFGLIQFQTSGLGEYTTWVYYMSPSGSGFTFTNSQPSSGRYVTNPCYNVTLDTANSVDSNCKSLASRYSNINTYQYMVIGASSDDPSINDVLYASSESALCVVYGGPSPATPYPPNRTLSQYESGSITVGYSNAKPSPCATATGPTNAGYVPYSQEVMYAERGFGFYTSGETANPSSSTSWPVLVPMTSAGQVPTQSSVNTALAKFSPYLAPETNSTSTSEIKAAATQSPIAGLLKAAKNYYVSANPASSNGCTATRYVVLVTDGLPTKDLSGNNWPPLGSAAAAGYGVTATFNADGSLNTTNDQALTDAVNVLASLNSAGIKTYIIGVGAGVDPTANPSAAATLTAMAIAGGSGSYFAATTEQQLNNDMQTILGKILAATQSTASTAVNSTGLHKGDVAYLAKFTTSDTYQDWTGDLSAYPIDPTTGTVNTAAGSATWSAQAQLDTKNWDSGRLIATWDPVAGAGTPFRWTSGTPTTGIASSTTLGTQLSTFYGDTNGQDVLNYLRGNSAKEQRNGGAFRNRAHTLGDIVNSAPLYVGAPQGFSQSTSYQTFRVNHKSRSPILYIGADDGMLHAFDAATGAERFAYIPNGVFANLVNLANPYYNEQHLFYVNGSPQAADVQYSTDQSWHTILVGTEGAGGKSVFALDVTSADSFTTESQVASAAMWEFTDSDMGYSFSEPAIANTKAGWLVLVGNGYDSTNEKPILYALDVRTGTKTAKIDLCAAVTSVCSTTVANGLSSVTAVNSYGVLGQAADTVYAGDLQGNVWRVDIRDSNPANWVVSVIFQAKDSSGTRQPITTAPAVALNPHYPRLKGNMVYVGTGQLLNINDLSTTQTQTLYGIFDPPTSSSPPLGFSGIPTRSNLVQQTMTTTTVSGVSVRVEGTVQSVNIPTDRGWYIDFNLAAGERFVTDPQVEAGYALVVVTYQPNTSSCTGGGNAWLTVVNSGTGGSFALPELDVNSSGTLDSHDQTTSGLNPVGVSLGGVYASAPTILATSQATNSGVGAKKLTAESSTNIATWSERGGGRGRIGWFEVRQ